MPAQTKRCRRCEIEKSVANNFYLGSSGYYATYCRPCARIVADEYRAANVEKCREQRRARRAADPERFRRAEAERYETSPGVTLSRAARERPCVDCGIRLPAQVMELDHVRGVKLFSVGGPRLSRRPAEEVVAEIAKCEVRCPNCHKLRHYHERQARKAAS